MASTGSQNKGDLVTAHHHGVPGTPATTAHLPNLDLTRQANRTPVIPVSEHRDHFHLFLQCCYPSCSLTITSLQEVIALCSSGECYQVPKVLSHCEDVLERCAESANASLAVYAIACRFGFERLARNAAKRSLSKTLDELLMQVSTQQFAVCLVAGDVFCNALRYHARCRDSLLQVATFDFWVHCRLLLGGSYSWAPMWVLSAASVECCARRAVDVLVCTPNPDFSHIEDRQLLQYSVAQWFWEFLEHVASEIQSSAPERKQVASTNLIAKAMQAMQQCSSCQPFIPDFVHFISKFEEQCVQAIEKVCERLFCQIPS